MSQLLLAKKKKKDPEFVTGDFQWEVFHWAEPSKPFVNGIDIRSRASDTSSPSLTSRECRVMNQGRWAIQQGGGGPVHCLAISPFFRMICRCQGANLVSSYPMVRSRSSSVFSSISLACLASCSAFLHTSTVKGGAKKEK